MTTIFLFIKGSKIAQYVLLAIAVAGIVLAVRQHYINLGKTKGAETQRVEQVNGIQQDHTSDRAATAAADADIDTRVRAAEQQTALAEARAEGYRAALATIAAMQSKLAQQTAGVRDVDLHSFNISQLGLRKQGEVAACYNPLEERAIATAVTQYPLCKAGSEKLEAAAAEDLAARADLNVKIAALGDKVSNNEKYTARLEGYYVQLWNANPPKVKAWKCLRLWSCGRNRLKPPGLSEVKAAR